MYPFQLGHDHDEPPPDEVWVGVAEVVGIVVVGLVVVVLLVVVFVVVVFLVVVVFWVVVVAARA